ncbi:MAG: peptide deformylase [Deltaproteobacteria bacterium]|nr:peptide deformylase [Deltaproteobacteria bacterium]
MAVRSIVTVPDPKLSERANAVIDLTEDICQLAADMTDTMYKAPGIGLAANQVGELVRVIVFDIHYAYAEPKDKKKVPTVLINPVILFTEGEEFKEEGCLSVPNFNVDVKRAARVQVEGIDIKGKPLKIEGEGLVARVIQHEIDHLEGKTLLDHSSALKRNLYHRRVKKSRRGNR